MNISAKIVVRFAFFGYLVSHGHTAGRDDHIGVGQRCTEHAEHTVAVVRGNAGVVNALHRTKRV